jgi:cytochrome c-type biogenesis protein CcmH
MIRALLVLLALAIVLPPAYAIDPTQLPTPELQQRYIELTHELRCLKCQNEAIADSPSQVADDLRNEVREQLIAGKTDDQIRDFLVARYGEFILFKPRFSLRNMWLWLGPGVLLLVGLYVAARIIRQRSALVAQDDQPLEEEAGR